MWDIQVVQHANEELFLVNERSVALCAGAIARPSARRLSRDALS
jgi:hypothetical protein